MVSIMWRSTGGFCFWLMYIDKLLYLLTGQAFV